MKHIVPALGALLLLAACNQSTAPSAAQQAAIAAQEAARAAQQAAAAAAEVAVAARQLAAVAEQTSAADLPHALVWDEIPSSFFNGKPLQPALIAPLRAASQRRQDSLDEFAYLKKSIEWFKLRQEQKTISLNIDDRRRQKESDDAFNTANKAEREKIAQGAYPYREVRIVPAPPPRIKAPDEKPADESETPLLDDDSDEAYPKSDVHLREALRILADALQLGQNPEVWSDPHAAPLTAQAVRR